MKWLTEYAGETYIFDDARLMASEARLQKRITAGMSPAAAERARFELDPDAWISALVIGRRRSGLDEVAAADVDADKFDLMACMAATTKAGLAEQAQAKAEPEPDVDAEPAPAS